MELGNDRGYEFCKLSTATQGGETEEGGCGKVFLVHF